MHSFSDTHGESTTPATGEEQKKGVLASNKSTNKGFKEPWAVGGVTFGSCKKMGSCSSDWMIIDVYLHDKTKDLLGITHAFVKHDF